MTEFLTVEKWRELVKMHLRRAFLSQWIDDRTDAEMDYCGERLIEDHWSVAKTTWAVREVCRKYRKLEQPLAMLCQTADGIRSRDGDTIGGWEQSSEFRQVYRQNQDERKQRECATYMVDAGSPICGGKCGDYPFCDGCYKLIDARPVDAGELLPPEARNV